MSANTQYNVVINDEVVATKSKKAQAVKAAKDLFDADTTVRVVVQTGAGTEVEVFEPRVAGTHAKPWTRVQEHAVEVEIPAGYTAAYARARVNAVVARADDKSGWIVVTPEGVTEVKNTVEAREFTNALAVAHKEAQAEARLAAEVAKAEAKSAREQERAEKKAAKEAEKEAKAQAKAEAKAAKEAEAAAAAEVTEAA
jgi:hypothetical protein